MFTLRRYQPSDMKAVEHLHVYAIQQTGAYLGRGPWDDDVYNIEEAYLNNKGEFLIGEWDDSFVAMGALHRTSSERAEIKRMRIHPDYQGRGFGQLILTELIARACVLGYKHCTWTHPSCRCPLRNSTRRTASMKLAETPFKILK